MRLISFKLTGLFLSLAITPIVMSACGKTPVEPQPEPEKPVVEVVMGGSFDSTWNRYSEGTQHPGQQSEAKVSKCWSDTLWQGDRAHKQLILWAKGKAVKNIKVNVSDLKGQSMNVSASNITVRYSTYVVGDDRTCSCGGAVDRKSVSIADALSETPVSGFTSSEPLKLWITVNVPDNTVPGKYEGKIEIARGNDVLDTFTLSFLVVNHKLPAVADWKYHLDIWQFPFQLVSLCKKGGNAVEPFSDDYYKLEKPFYSMLADAGQRSITTYIKDGAFNGGQTMVDWRRKANGDWEFDYTKFDSFVSFMMGLGIDAQINCFSPAGWNDTVRYLDLSDNQTKKLSLTIGDGAYNEVWNCFLDSFKEHLTAKGWFDKAVLYLDEVPEFQLQAIVDMVKKHDPSWKIGVAGNWYSYDLTTKLFEHSPIISCTDKSGAQRVTFYTSCSQTYPNNYVTSDNSPVELIYMSWYALANGYDGYLRWAYDYWTNPDPMNAQDGSNAAGDFHFIYRSSNDFSTCVPLSSARFELLREGIQDYEKALILGKDKFTGVFGYFRYNTKPDSRKAVNKAETMLKKYSAE